MMDELPANSHKSKEEEEKKSKKKAAPEEKKVSKVVSGEVVVQKPGLLTRLKDTFFGGDFTTVARYVGSEVFLPALRTLVVETATKSVERAIYGETSPRRRSSSIRDTQIRYDTPLRREISDPRRSRYNEPLVQRGGRRPQDVGDILVTNKEDADRVIDTLVEIVEVYEVASVAELFELLGQPSTHTETKWGWTNLPYARAVQTRHGWLLDLPPVEPIDV
jgi:hypothetical protein